ncbi:MAG: VWA domain-containing protein [Gemmataceae bacterium]|nr:VWA domain-containing protein [Gemmataceae bacterium]MDW8263994.1 VWA domain-containing protein [Gemmataceae bacterium]
MRLRHRIPTIFNLSMVDVLCCALGCVILLWLLNLREAKQRLKAVGETTQLLASTRGELEESQKAAARLRQDLAASAAQVRELQEQRQRLLAQAQAAEQERQQLAKDLAAARSQVAELIKDKLALQGQAAQVAELLRKKTGELQELTRDKTTLESRLADLQALLRERDTQIAAAARSVDDLAARLRDAEARAKQMGTQLEAIPGLRAEARTAQEKLSLAERRIALLEKELASQRRELADASRQIGDLQNEKKSLLDLSNRLRAAADNRFAGISLTGRKVVFLVDMSGSMELVEEKVTAPQKWTEVRQTLIKIMRSLPDLEQFQVILFSDKATFLLGQEYRWIDFAGKSSIDQVEAALAAIRPKGNTNMYAAFETAFRFRSLGLDTIYLFSDGIPNIGEGLPVNAFQLKETERAEILAKHVRKTLRAEWNRPIAGRPVVRIHSIGFFYESPDVGAFLWALSRENEGSFVGMSKP